MRLLQLQSKGEFSLTSDLINNIPPYAILSHTWRSDAEEVTFKDLIEGTGKSKAGYEKIRFCGEQARRDGLQYFWVDTCCIDKSSSTELTEAINSMFHWYRKAARCYVFLSDVSVDDLEQDDHLWKSAFMKTRWFSRGWTLQELLAPASVEFFSREGERLGDKMSLETEIAEITEISVLALRGNPLYNFSIADRMSWTANRMTTREEDKAYCLLGIFDVYMPLIYGEGKRAFTRLNEEVSKSSRDIAGTHVTAPTNAVGATAAPSASTSTSASSSQTLREAAQRKKQTHTGSWFLRGEQYNEWQSGATPLLWISGSPGSGKTILCSTIIENLLAKSEKDNSVAMVYYFFDFGEAETRTLNLFFRSLIMQLSINLPDLPQNLSDLYASCRDNKQEPPTESLKGVVRTILTEVAEVTIVVDALDECSEPEELVNFLGEMRSWTGVDLRLLVVSRHHFEGTDFLQDLQPVHVSIQDEAANNDISNFVQEILSKDLKLRYWPPKVKNEIETALVSKSNGMFRWVACQTDILRSCRTQQDVDNVLLTLPRTLEETYDRILDAICDTYKAGVRAVLQWLAFAERPMRLEEVAELVAFDATHAAFDIKRRLLNPLMILTMCSSLLVENKTYCYDYDFGHGKVSITELRLAHFTVKDYLLSRSLQNSRYVYYSIEPKSSNLQIAKACLAYLNMSQFSAGFRGRRTHLALMREWPLLDYAARFCGFHLRIVENDLDLSARSQLQQLLSTHVMPNGGNFGTFVGTVWRTATQESIQTTKPLYFAASYGLISVVRLLLIDVTEADLEAKGGHFGSSPLQVASYRGNTDCVRLLLAAGADPNSTNDLNETSLYWARCNRSVEIVEILRRYGATR